MPNNRKYNGKDVEMLITAKTITKHFQQNKNQLIAIRPAWQDPYIENLQTRIDYAISNFLGLDPKKQQKLATQNVLLMQQKALEDLMLFKLNIEADYNNQPERLQWLLSTLGFAQHQKAALNKDQEALIELLQQFKLNMDANLKTELVDKGISQQLIDGIEQQADPIKEANIEQESLKNTSKTLTQEALDEFNEIFTEIMAIGKIAAKVFKKNPAVKDQFIFSKVARKLNSKGIEKPDIRRGIEGIEGIEADQPGIE